MNTDEQPEEEESECKKPCDPNSGCEECAGYWQRMVKEGLWDGGRHRWTGKGWHHITKCI